MSAARAPQEVGRLMVVDAVPFIGTIFAPGATAEMMKPQAEAMAAAMRAQYGKPKPAGPVADPGAASMVGTMSNTPAGRIAIAGWMPHPHPPVRPQPLSHHMTPPPPPPPGPHAPPPPTPPPPPHTPTTPPPAPPAPHR